MSALEKGCSQSLSGLARHPAQPGSAAATTEESQADADGDDDDFELFGSDDEVIVVLCS